MEQQTKEILILRQLSEYSLADVIGALLFKVGISKTLDQIAKVVERLAKHYSDLAETTKHATNKMPGTDEVISDYYLKKAHRLKTLQIGLFLVKTCYEKAKDSIELTEEEKAFVEGRTDKLPCATSTN